MRHVGVRAVRQVVHVGQTLVEPLLVGVLGGQFRLDLVVADDATLGGVDEEHAAGLQPDLLHDGGGVDRQDADLGGHDDEAVVGHPETRGAQAVAVQDGADDGAVGEAHRRGPSHGSMSDEWYW